MSSSLAPVACQALAAFRSELFSGKVPVKMTDVLGRTAVARCKSVPILADDALRSSIRVTDGSTISAEGRRGSRVDISKCEIRSGNL
jgi:hypothetical protein